MPLYRVTTYKEFNGAPFQGEKWSNVYYVQAGDASGAVAVGVIVLNAEMAVSYQPIIGRTVTAVNVANKDDKDKSNPNAEAELDPTGLGGYLPLFNTTRVVFLDEVKRPESKYLRTGATPDNIGAGEWSTEYVDFVNTNYADVLDALTSLRGPNNEELGDGFTIASIQNRQLGWHRRTRPGFKRGWVPV